MKSVKSIVVALGVVASTLGATGALSLASSTPASGSTVADCLSSQIRLTHGVANGAAGTIYYPIVFTNTGATCAIFGVPAIQPVRGTGHHKVGPLARNLSMGLMPMRQIVTSGGSVSVAFGVTDAGNYPSSTCVARAADGVLVSLGSFITSRYVHLPIRVCTKISSTTTRLIVAGTTGA